MMPFLEPFKPCINAVLNPCMGVLDYCTLVYRIEDMKFGGNGIKFKGDCCTYHQNLCCVALKDDCSCFLYSMCCGGSLIQPTYLDEHICEDKEEGTFQPGTRWQDASQCKDRVLEIRKQVQNEAMAPFSEHMYMMRPIPDPTCCETLGHCCSDYGTQQVALVENELKYIRVGNKKLKFTGDAAGFNALKLSCCAKMIIAPCYSMHKMVGTYTAAHNQYIDNHLAWADEQPEGMAVPEPNPMAAMAAIASVGGVGVELVPPAMAPEAAQAAQAPLTSVGVSFDAALDQLRAAHLAELEKVRAANDKPAAGSTGGGGRVVHAKVDV